MLKKVKFYKKGDKMKRVIKNIIAIIIFAITAFAIYYVKVVQKTDIITPTSIKIERTQPKEIIPTIASAFETKRDHDNNIDSLAVWHGPKDQNWLFATAKAKDKIIIYDAATGKLIKEFGSNGQKLGEFIRPNGIVVIDDLAFVTERDGARVQVFTLPDCRAIGIIGEESLKRPYGAATYKTKSGKYRLYVTDDYKADDPKQMNKRVHLYEVEIDGSKVDSELIKTFGDVSGNGVLYKVESILVDRPNKRLFVADENKEKRDIKIYTLEGEFVGSFLGKGLFRREPEGIAIYATSKDDGFIIATDQNYTNNTFHVFDRHSLKHLASFQAKNTTNTDGITITNKSFGKFKKGAFYAVHDDGNVVAIDWALLSEKLGLDKYSKPYVEADYQYDAAIA